MELGIVWAAVVLFIDSDLTDEHLDTLLTEPV